MPPPHSPSQELSRVGARGRWCLKCLLFGPIPDGFANPWQGRGRRQEPVPVPWVGDNRVFMCKAAGFTLPGCLYLLEGRAGYVGYYTCDSSPGDEERSPKAGDAADNRCRLRELSGGLTGGQEGHHQRGLVSQGRVSSWDTQRQISKACEETSEELRALPLGSHGKAWEQLPRLPCSRPPLPVSARSALTAPPGWHCRHPRSQTRKPRGREVKRPAKRHTAVA